MDNKLTSVKNPLTIIAIFAGIAEISGTAVLPLIAPDNQALYIWFLMLFPFALITLFFLTLNLNHRVLYVPSDFRDEDNFVNILKKSTYSEVLEYKEKEANAVVLGEVAESYSSQIQNQDIEQPSRQNNSDTTPNPPPSIEQWINNVEAVLLEFDSATTRSQRNQMDLIVAQISERRVRDVRLAEKLALESLEKELGVPIDREMKIEFGQSRFHFDGIARRGGALTAIEVKYFKSRRSVPMNMSMWQPLRRSLEALFQSLSEEQRRNFSFILALVNDSDANEVKQLAESRLSDLPFPIAIKLYDFDALVAQQSSSQG
ncbi:hypothetical protein H7F10_16365 [Acidithiobacillus sp. HP-6]|uniref:hypothetical protein n=1 Tax=unclassified Acidithiobacillus TaxID=2614800 RepID=UPI00187A2B3F|nr:MULTISPECIES: hypothetical protein [unclassified Acidithiobacillus]MBE7564453.1 hypothetical protein [Acidithiobacillus sp. HP-6]MBE7571088.1 hypothetical protein [Acidithiobacillus sp. HP-2]